jgi:SAM-dependent methyltransferase
MSEQTIDADAFNAFEAASWEEATDAYDRVFGPVTRRVIDPLLDAAAVQAGTRLLDLATGPGYVAARAAERGARVTAIDVAPSMVALARERHPAIDFREADAEQPPFPDGSFDAVIGSFMVLHLGRPEEAARQAARVLRPGGRAAFSMWDTPDRARLLDVILKAIADAGAETPSDIPPGPPFFRFSDDAEFARLLDDAGFEDVRVETIAFTHPFAGADEIWHGFTRGTGRTRWIIEKQTREVRTRIRAALDARVREYEVPAGGLEVPISVKIASGRKG